MKKTIKVTNINLSLAMHYIVKPTIEVKILAGLIDNAKEFVVYDALIVGRLIVEELSISNQMYRDCIGKLKRKKLLIRSGRAIILANELKKPFDRLVIINK